MDVTVGARLPVEEVLRLLEYFDDSSDRPLHEGLDFDSYSKKLSEHAFFVLAHRDGRCAGFIAYYLNEEGGFIYVPQIVVHKKSRHEGVGHVMLADLCSQYAGVYRSIRLEVLKGNVTAQRFYSREGFFLMREREDRKLLSKTV